ncbi:D-alanyl-D-alanine carboxypeptidase family protein [Clostridium gelidum]|uniref:D-alanyl-D-alanine carboxypeptidase family protein n=1 Tax=Clostridium gelidum TaxID=704125 RepID=UPI001CC710E3|nr:D-alanyl-D-alanine carboxypeptidase family protein [Clostridium gelidum]
MDKLKKGKWLKSNAQKFGFIMRYIIEKESITGCNYKCWHIRCAGIKVAKEIFNKTYGARRIFR